MPLIGRALARLAARTGGQLMLELPDDLQPTFIAQLLEGANAENPKTPTFALFVHGERKDVTTISPRVDFRELAMYRQGSHLAMAFASDNRGMSTYSSVYPLLVSNGFPSTHVSSSGAGVASLEEFSSTLADVLVDHVGTHDLSIDEFQKTIWEILGFLAETYEIYGNGQSSFASDWWLHVHQWVGALSIDSSRSDEPVGIPRLYGCAGLPVPARGHSLAMTPKDYITVLQARWCNLSAITEEIGRLQGIETAEKAATLLGKINWENETYATSLRSDSPVALVAMAMTSDPQERIRAWSSLSETDFEKSFVEAKGKLGFRRYGAELSSAWKNALPVLVAKANEVVGLADSALALEEVELVLPYKADSDRKSLPNDASLVLPFIRINGARGCSAVFEVMKDSAEFLADGLHLRGTMTISPSKKSPNLAWVEASATGEAAHFLADLCNGSFTLLRPNEVALWAKPQGRSAKSSLRGPVVWSSTSVDPVSVELPALGAYEFAIAWGSTSGIESHAVTLRGKPFAQAWPGMEHEGAKISVEITDIADVGSSSQPIFQIQLYSSSERPLSPVIAAAHGMQPDTTLLLEEDVLSYFEAKFGDCLFSIESGHALGCFLATSSREKVDLVQNGDGIQCTPDLQSRTGLDLSPGFPSAQLLSHPAYVALLKAYVTLGIPEAIDTVEKEEGSAGLTVSRIALDSIPVATMSGLLEAYRVLLASSIGLSPTDQFWAQNPFSVVLFEEGSGFQSAQAILLSPFHPIRLAWIWSLQIGLREAYDDGANPAASLALLDGTNFPSRVVLDNHFGKSSAFMSVPVDSRPNDLYLGWHASVDIINKRAAIPEWIAGRRFPVDGLSAISASSVGSAIDDFLRVSPHVQSLQLELTNTVASRRSSSIDDGVMAKLGELALASTGLDGVAGIRVLDSENRVGSIPRFSGIEDAISMARPGFNVEWVSAPANQVSNSHVTFLEGSAALLAMDSTSAASNGWIPALPLRRTPIRTRQSNFSSVDYTLADRGSEAQELEKTLFAYESCPSGSHVLQIIPNPSGVAGKPSWLVAGDFGVDPKALSNAVRNQSESDYILWDWRPATTIKPNLHVSSRAQPYIVLASVPPALNNAIRSRLKALNEQLSPETIQTRTKLLISTLAERAIGLNTLLSVGHHQATGALGFYFALRSIGTWLDSAPTGETRLVIPVDAVDPFLRASVSPASDGSRKRADLLAVRGWIGPDNLSHIVLVPLEIKHYGLSSREQEPTFPLAGEARLIEHVDQLVSYQKQLQSLCEAYQGAVGSQASLLGQRLVAVLDAAIQLSTNEVIDAGKLLSSIASGHAEVELGKGILLWYQARARDLDGNRASWDEIGGALATRRNDVRVDPTAFDGCFWNDEEGLAHQVVREALDDASEIETSSVSIATSSMASGKKVADQAVVATSTPKIAPSADTVPLQVPASVAPNVNESVAPAATAIESNAVVAQTEAPSRPARKKLSAAELEKRYAELLATLSEFNVKVERPRNQVPYQEGPAFIEYAVFPSYGVSVNKIESQLENLKLRMRLPSDAEIGCSTHMGNVLLTVPKADEERYFIDAEELWSRWQRPASGFKVPVGEDATGDVIEIDLANSNSPHLLIAGVTGSGKSEALLTILHGAARYYTPDELRLRLIDPKQTELNTLAELPHTDGQIGWSGEEAIALLEEAVEEMERRYKTFRLAGSDIRNISEYQSKKGPMARWIIVLDEYADLISDDAERKQIEKFLQRLSQKARAAGIHVIVSTQKPVVQVVNTVVKGNLPGKIALRVNTATESRVIMDEAGAEQLVGKGDAIVRAGNTKARIQFARYAI